jgi:ABC-type microcin C transport system duplicated ATPase subunit YejF
MSIEAQIAEALRIHRHLSRADSEAKALATLAAINGLP